MSTANEFTKLLLETNKAVQAFHLLLDYVDLIKAQGKELAPEASASADKIKSLTEDGIGKEIEKLRNCINEALNKIEIVDEDLKSGANNLILYHNTIKEAVEYATRQEAGYEENSYWNRYWSGICDILKEKQEEP